MATGIGAAGLLVGAVTGGLMLSKKSAISAGCKPGPGGVEDCNATGASAGNAAKTLGAAASAGFVIGLAGVATGLGLFLSEPAKPSEPRAGLHPRAHGVFAGALELGPGGVLLGVRGDL